MEQTYDSDEILQTAKEIIHEIEKYLKAALKKPVYLHAVILDPRIKMFLFSKHAGHFAQCGIHARMIPMSFAVAASRYSTHAAVTMATEEAGEEVDDFEDFICAKRQKITNVDREIVKYLGEDLADRDVDPLGYWHRRQVDLLVWARWRGPFGQFLLPVSLPSVLFFMGGLI